MEKLLLAGAIALFGVVGAQQKNSVKVNPFALLGGSDMISYERAISENSTVGAGLGIGGFKLGDFKYSNSGIGVSYRYYFKQALHGWYGTGIASYNDGKIKVDNDGVKYNGLGLTANAGYQWLWNSGFTVDLSGGLSYTHFSYSGGGIINNLKTSGVLPTLGVALGYSF